MENLNVQLKELTQMVQMSKDDSKQVEQSVTYDEKDGWINIVHGSHELSMSTENWIKLQELANKVVSGIKFNSYEGIKKMKLKDAKPILEQMTELQIIELMKEDAKMIKFRWYDITGLTKILLSELFKRNGLGYKSVDRLSGSQKTFLRKFNIYKF